MKLFSVVSSLIWDNVSVMDSGVLLSLVALCISIIAIIVSIRAWHKSRAIYDIETTPLRGDTIQGVRDKLNTGEYTILSVHEQSTSLSGTKVVLGRVKKAKNK